MIPVAAGSAPVRAVSATAFAGVVMFFLLERLVLWRHGHEAGHLSNPAASLILVGDAFHNFVDDVVIAAAFLTSVPGAFLVGFAVSLFLLPCTSGPYIAILGLLAKTATRSDAMLWQLLYSAIFILPMVLINGAVYYGFTTAERVEAWRATRLPLLHLVAGIILLLLGLAMAASLWFAAA